MNETTQEIQSLEEFQEGMRFFKAGNYEVASVFFGELLERHCVLDEETRICRSWQGLSQTLAGDPAGVVQCRIACREGESRPELQLFLNLARAELACGDRARLMQALERGLALYPDSTVLRELHARYERRKEPVIRFLDRRHPLNRWLGRIKADRLRRNAVVSSGSESAG